MESQLSAVVRQQLDRFCRQYLQILLELDYPAAECLRQDTFQQALYARLFKDGAIGNEPPERYQLRVLKELTKRIEDSIQDWEEEGISDDLMNHLSTLVSSSIPSATTTAQTQSYVTYTLSSLPAKDGQGNGRDDGSFEKPTITLLESRNTLLAHSTTGVRTWEAALHLGIYLSQHPSLIYQQRILELGAGTGYLSILAAAHLGASHVLATDGSDDVVSSLETNFYLNALESSSVIRAAPLTWGHALVGGESARWNDGGAIDVVLGADLTYDDSAIPSLVATFGDLLGLYPEVKILYAGTVRNEETFGKFLKLVRRSPVGLVVEEVGFEVPEREKQEGPFYDDRVPIRICVITKKARAG